MSSEETYIPLTEDGEDTECLQSSPEACMSDVRSPRFSTEAWEIIKSATPLTVGFFADHFIEIIHLIFLGHLPAEELAAAALAMLFCNATGLCLIMGIMSGVETLTSQAYGAKNYRRMVVVLQRGLLIGACLTLPIFVLRYSSRALLLFFGIDEAVAVHASDFIYVVTLDVPSLVVLEALRRYAQSIDRGDVTFYNTLVGVCLTPIFDYYFVVHLDWGYIGVAWTFVLATLVMVAHILCYFAFSPRPLFLCPGGFFWARDAWLEWDAYLRLAVPGALSLAAEWVGLEAQTFIASYQGVSTLGAQSILFNLSLLLFMVPMSIATIASARVGRYLGANQPFHAKFSAKTAVLLAAVVMAVVGLAITIGAGAVGRVFTDDPGVLHAFEISVPLLAVYSALDGMQGVAAGVLRGCGLQDLSFKLNLVAFWVVALPLAYVCALRWGTHVDVDAFIRAGDATHVPGWGIRGQWLAMTVASLGLCVAVFGLLIYRLDWHQQARLVAARERAAALAEAAAAAASEASEDEFEGRHCPREVAALLSAQEQSARQVYGAV